MEEIWKDIPGYEGIYQASNIGRIRNLEYIITEVNGKRRKRRARVLSNKLPKGARYYQLHLHKERDCKLFRVHQLVAMAFLPNPLNLPEVNHKDHDKLNNLLSNLEWCDHPYNNMESVNFHKKYGQNLYNSKLKEADIPFIRQRLAKKESCASIAKDYKISKGTIQSIKSGQSWVRF